MRVTTEHRKRKDLHIHMVLVSTAAGGVDPNDLSQGDDHVQRDRKEELVAVPSLQVDNRRRRQSRDQQNIGG